MSLLSFVFNGFRRDGTRVKMKPAPRFKPVTVGQCEHVCAILDVEVDLLISGELELVEMSLPKLARAPLLLDAILENGNKYNVNAWTPVMYEGFMSAVIANFIFRCAIS